MPRMITWGKILLGLALIAGVASARGSFLPHAAAVPFCLLAWLSRGNNLVRRLHGVLGPARHGIEQDGRWLSGDAQRQEPAERRHSDPPHGVLPTQHSAHRGEEPLHDVRKFGARESRRPTGTLQETPECRQPCYPPVI